MNETLFNLLALLADGKTHSGEQLAQSLSMSRTAVWKQLKKLDESGLSLQVIKGKGYCLENRFELLRRELLSESLNGESSAYFSRIDVLGETDSTNKRAQAFLQSAQQGAYACFAETQTRGKGRRGRDWISPIGNIAFSMTYGFDGSKVSLDGLSLTVGLAIARALARLGVDGIKLKWPNDLLLGGKKLGGILLEMQGDPQGQCQIVIGVGINYAPLQAKADIDQPVASLSEAGVQISRNFLCGQLLNELVQSLMLFSSQGFAAFVGEWSALDAYANCPVRLAAGERVEEGVAKGVNDRGALLLDQGGEYSVFYGGEVSLRPIDEL